MCQKTDTVISQRGAKIQDLLAYAACCFVAGFFLAFGTGSSGLIARLCFGVFRPSAGLSRPADGAGVLCFKHCRYLD